MADRKTAEQMTLERRANKAKRRSKGKKNESGFSMTDAKLDQSRRQRFESRLDQEFAAAKKEIEATGKTFASGPVVSRLKDHYKGTAVRWKQLDDKVFFSKVRKVA